MGNLRNILNINHLAYKYSILLLVTYFYYLIIFIYLEYVHIRVHICATVHVCRSENNFRESVISFHHTCLGAQTQVIRQGGTFCPLSHLVFASYVLNPSTD